MKNKISKILGVVLVLTVLAGLLISFTPVSPISAAALDMAWSNQGTPGAVPFNVMAPAANGNKWLFDVAGDGKTMFAINNASTVVTSVALAATYTLGVASTDGFPDAGSICITNQISSTTGLASVISYTGRTINSFTGIAATAMPVPPVGGETVTPSTIVYKSTNAGGTWSTTALGTGLANTGPYVALSVSSDFANDATVILANKQYVYRSGDGGVTFGQLGATADAPVNPGVFPAGSNITSIDVGPHYTGGTAFLVGLTSTANDGSGGAFRMTSATFNWSKLAFNGDIYAVAFSPNYRNDALVMAIGGATPANVGEPSVHFWTQLADRTAYVNRDVLAGDFPNITNNPSIRATMAFPQDYDYLGNSNVFVGLGVKADFAIAAPEAGYGAYRVTGRASPALTSLVTDLWVSGINNPTNVYSVAFKGNLADGWLYIGQQNEIVVRRATSAGGSSLNFMDSTRSPRGSYNVQVATSPIADDTSIWAITGGVGSALSISTNTGINFSLLSLINISASTNMYFLDLAVVDANNMFLLAYDDSNMNKTQETTGEYNYLFKTTNGGGSWLGVYCPTELMSKIYLSPAYATDKTLYIPAFGTSRIWKSSDAGETFAGYSSGTITAITAFAAVDASTYYVGGSNAVGKGGYTTPAQISGETPYSFAYVSATDMFIGTKEGSIYRSLNGGVSFIPVGTPRYFGMNSLPIVITDTAYATNKTIYIGCSTGTYAGVSRWTVDTSATYKFLKLAVVTSMSQTGDGSLYVTNAPAFGTAASEVSRCASPTQTPTDPTWDTMSTPVQGFSVSMPYIYAVKTIATGTPQVPNNTVYAVMYQTTPGPTQGPAVQAIKDTCVASPATVSPNGTTDVPTNTIFTWTPQATGLVGIKYDVQIAYDKDFTNNLIFATGGPGGSTGIAAVSGTVFVPSSTQYLVSPLQPGLTYYWRVRVGTGAPWASKWSAGIKFNVQLTDTNFDLAGSPGVQLQPAAGATNIPLKPVFQWAWITGAVSYDLQVADNPVFVNPMDSQTGLNTNVWTFTKTLDNSKTYYWRVRAVSASGVYSAWASGAFTTVGVTTAAPTGTVAPAPTTVTISAPVVTPTVTVNIPSQPAPIVTVTVPPGTTQPASTPASIWVLIAIGAVLIIAVIVLIARTRRV